MNNSEDFTDEGILSIDPNGKVFAPEIAPKEVKENEAKQKAPFPLSFEEELQQMPKRVVEEANKKYPEYMEQENAQKLYEEEVRNSEALSPLSLIYYISQDSSDYKDSRNLDLKYAREEQGKIYELYSSKHKSNLIDWETALQNSSGWKEIFTTLNIPNFGEKTMKYLLVHSFIADVHNDTKLAGVLKKTASLIESNIKQLNNNGA